MSLQRATLTLTKTEYNRLLQTGFVELDDPERGWIEVWMLFDETNPGIKEKQLRVNVVRSGTALKKKL